MSWVPKAQVAALSVVSQYCIEVVAWYSAQEHSGSHLGHWSRRGQHFCSAEEATGEAHLLPVLALCASVMSGALSACSNLIPADETGLEPAPWEHAAVAQLLLGARADQK